MLCCKLSTCLQGSQRAEVLLDSMHFFALPQTLLSFAQGEAVVLVMMRFVEAVTAFGEPAFR